MFLRIASAFLFLTLLTSCNNGFESVGRPRILPGTLSGLFGVVKSRAMITVDMNEQGEMFIKSADQVPVTVTNAPFVEFALDVSKFAIPTISNRPLDFGDIAIQTLTDNDLRVCGATGKKKCSQAYVQIYTTGSSGDGIYNEDGGYGMPITATLGANAAKTVGLNVAKAAVMQTHVIPNNKNVLRLADFAVLPNYNIDSDFTEAGAGTYSTTLVIEYGLLE